MAQRSPARPSPLQAPRVARLRGVSEAEAHAHRLVALVPLHAAQGVVQLVPCLLLRQQRKQGMGGERADAGGRTRVYARRAQPCQLL